MPIEPPAAERLHAVLLAAGPSLRFGSPKQLAEFQGQSLVRRAAQSAAAVAGGGMTIVLGAHSRQVEEALRGIDAQIVLNAEWRDGMASSVRKGLVTLPPAATAVLLLPCDQPLAGPEFLQDLSNEWQRDRSKIITCVSERNAGLPAIVPRRYLKALMSIKGDPGINSFFARNRHDSVEVRRAEIEADIKSQGDLDQLPGQNANTPKPRPSPAANQENENSQSCSLGSRDEES